MGESIDLRSTSTLSDLDHALGRFAAAATDALTDADHDAQRRLAMLQERRRVASADVGRLQNAFTAAEGEARAAIGAALAEAENKLRVIEHWLARVEEVLCAFHQASQRLSQVANDHTARARHVLQLKQDEIEAYLSTEIVLDQALTVPSQQTTISRVSAAVPRVALASIVSYPLPSGFQWVPLDRLDLSDNLWPEETFRKVSEDDVRRGFGTLVRDLLPYLSQHPNANGSTFAEVDGYTPEGFPKRRQKAFETFFGSEPIVLDGPRVDGTYSVTNGRHRIDVARTLGWKAIPAKVNPT
jgi:hypothetical protein